MPLGLATAGLIGAGASAAGGIASGLFGNKARRKAATKKYQRDLENWHRQNAYNDPSAQMARLKAAGLNPNMIYGSGTQAATGMASSPAAAPEESIQNIPVPDVGGELSRYASIQQMQQNTQRSAADTALKWGQLGLQALQVDHRKLTVEQQKLQNEILAETGMAIAQNKVTQGGATIESTRAGTDTKRQQLKNIKQQYKQVDQNIKNLRQSNANQKTVDKLNNIKLKIESKYLKKWEETGVDPRSPFAARFFGEILQLLTKPYKEGRNLPKYNLRDINKLFPGQVKDLSKEELKTLNELINAQY